jgi:hypothetical protein
MEKSKNRLDVSSEELERVLLQKEGESLKDGGLQPKNQGVAGKRVLGKAVAKGGLLLKGKNPGNVSISFPVVYRSPLLLISDPKTRRRRSHTRIERI